MKINFVEQVAIATITFATLGWWLLGENGTPFFYGSMWGVGNLILIKQLFKHLLQKEKNYFKILFFISLKFPLIYLTGYILLKTQFEYIAYLLTGFMLPFVMMIVIALKENLKNLKKRPTT